NTPPLDRPRASRVGRRRALRGSSRSRARGVAPGCTFTSWQEPEPPPSPLTQPVDPPGILAIELFEHGSRQGERLDFPTLVRHLAGTGEVLEIAAVPLLSAHRITLPQHPG